MQHWRPRETRRPVRLTVRVRTEDGWIDATVRNLSQRGMMLDCRQPLRRNQFVEIARGPCRVVGRIVWADDDACGLRAQDCVDIADFLAAPQSGGPQRTNDRRGPDRPPARPAVAATLQERADSARRAGRAFEFGVLLAGIACIAAIAVSSVFDVLNAPLAQVGSALARG